MAPLLQIELSIIASARLALQGHIFLSATHYCWVDTSQRLTHVKTGSAKISPHESLVQMPGRQTEDVERVILILARLAVRSTSGQATESRFRKASCQRVVVVVVVVVVGNSWGRQRKNKSGKEKNETRVSTKQPEPHMQQQLESSQKQGASQIPLLSIHVYS